MSYLLATSIKEANLIPREALLNVNGIAACHPECRRHGSGLKPRTDLPRQPVEEEDATRFAQCYDQDECVSKMQARRHNKPNHSTKVLTRMRFYPDMYGVCDMALSFGNKT